MLKTRVIPVLLAKQMGIVKGANFDSWRRVGPILPTVRVYDLRDVDELVLLDVEGTSLQRPISPALVQQVASAISVPLTVGGGISSVDDAERLFEVGADRVVLNSATYRDPSLVETLASTFGSQSVVVSIDARFGSAGWVCWSASGSRSEGVSPMAWGRHVENLGAGEILLSSIDHEGLMQGYALDLLSELSASVTVPIIASGGAGSASHMCDAVLVGGASAVAAGSIFHFTQITPKDLKTSLAECGIPTRAHVSRASPSGTSSA
jgi:cyclase